MKFEVFKDTLFVRLGRNEAVRCESDGTVSFSPNVHVSGEMTSGILSAIARKIFTGETFFMQVMRCMDGNGEVLVAPKQLGEIHVIEEIRGCPVFMRSGAYLASGEHVKVSTVNQNLFGAMFSGNGLFVLQAAGDGPLAFSGFGTVVRRDLEPGQSIMIDNGHILAWDASTQYTIELANRTSIYNSLTSGEAIVCKFTGPGSVWIQTRSVDAFKHYLAEKQGPPKQNWMLGCIGLTIGGIIFCFMFMVIVWIIMKNQSKSFTDIEDY